MGRYLLDSNAFLWFKAKPQALRSKAREAIENTQNGVFVSVASLWELSIKAAAGRLQEYEHLFDDDAAGLQRNLDASGLALLSVDLPHVTAAARLPRHHGDPFDRMLAAQALSEDLVLITSDDAFRRYAGLNLLAA